MPRLLLVLLCAAPLAACKSSPVNWSALAPASQADLDALKADTDADREAVVAGLNAVKDDLGKAGLSAPDTERALNDIAGRIDEIKDRPASGGVPGALIAALGGNLPPVLDWLLTLLLGGGATAAEVNRRRNKTRAAALAKVAAPAKPPTPTV